jgi:hypothetical protein
MSAGSGPRLNGLQHSSVREVARFALLISRPDFCSLLNCIEVRSALLSDAAALLALSPHAQHAFAAAGLAILRLAPNQPMGSLTSKVVPASRSETT